MINELFLRKRVLLVVSFLVLFGGCSSPDENFPIVPSFSDCTGLESHIHETGNAYCEANLLSAAKDNAAHFGITVPVTNIQSYIDGLQKPVMEWKESGETSELEGKIYPMYHSPHKYGSGFRPWIAVVADKETASLYTDLHTIKDAHLLVEIVYVNLDNGYTKIIKPFPNEIYETTWTENISTELDANAIKNIGDNYSVFIHVVSVEGWSEKAFEDGYRMLNAEVKK